MIIVTKYPLHKLISFWLCVGLFIYFTGNLFYLLFVTQTDDNILKNNLRIVNVFVTILKNVILALAWLGTEKIETQADVITLPDNLGLDDDIPFINKSNL